MSWPAECPIAALLVGMSLPHRRYATSARAPGPALRALRQRPVVHLRGQPALPGECGPEVRPVHRRVQGYPAEPAVVVALSVPPAEREHLLARRVGPQRHA